MFQDVDYAEVRPQIYSIERLGEVRVQDQLSPSMSGMYLLLLYQRRYVKRKCAHY